MAKKKKKAAKKAKKAKKAAGKSAVKKAPGANPMTGLLAWYAQESKATLRMIGAIPNDKLGTKIHAKFRTAGELAIHLGDAMNDLMVTLKSGRMAFGKPSTFATTEEMLAHYKKTSQAFMANAKSISKSNLTKKYPFEMNGKIMWEPTGMEMAQTWVCHEIHHRAHIGAILRVLDAKVPGMYGPTADDM